MAADRASIGAVRAHHYDVVIFAVAERFEGRYPARRPARRRAGPRMPRAVEHTKAAAVEPGGNEIGSRARSTSLPPLGANSGWASLLRPPLKWAPSCLCPLPSGRQQPDAGQAAPLADERDRVAAGGPDRVAIVADFGGRAAVSPAPSRPMREYVVAARPRPGQTATSRPSGEKVGIGVPLGPGRVTWRKAGAARRRRRRCRHRARRRSWPPIRGVRPAHPGRRRSRAGAVRIVRRSFRSGSSSGSGTRLRAGDARRDGRPSRPARVIRRAPRPRKHPEEAPQS